MEPVPAISYVVPTLNSAATLETTLLSLRAQGSVAPRVIVVDSGSTDGTLALCERARMETLYAELGNLYRAVNIGLRQCQTEWLGYLNSDDWLYPGTVARLLADSADADVVYGNCDYSDGGGRFVYSFAAAHPAQLLSLFRTGRMGFAQPAALFRRRLFERLQGFDESFQHKADAAFFLRALQTGARFAYLDGPPVACFRLHAGQLSNRASAASAAEGARLFNRRDLSAGWRERVKDNLILLDWRRRNLPHYLIRVLRESALSQRLRLPRAQGVYDHQ